MSKISEKKIKYYLDVIDKIGATKVDRRNRPIKDVKMKVTAIK